MSALRLELEKELARIKVKRDQVLEPTRKRYREEEEEIGKPFDDKIAELSARIDEEKNKGIWLVYAKRRGYHPKIQSAYFREWEARANCPEDSEEWGYFVKHVCMNRTRDENIEGDVEIS
jgi:hypothetical protein